MHARPRVRAGRVRAGRTGAVRAVGLVPGRPLRVRTARAPCAQYMPLIKPAGAFRDECARTGGLCVKTQRMAKDLSPRGGGGAGVRAWSLGVRPSSPWKWPPCHPWCPSGVLEGSIIIVETPLPRIRVLRSLCRDCGRGERKSRAVCRPVAPGSVLNSADAIEKPLCSARRALRSLCWLKTAMVHKVGPPGRAESWSP